MAGQASKPGMAPRGRADMQQSRGPTAVEPAAEGRQPSSIAAGRADRQQQQQPAGRGQQQPAGRGQQQPGDTGRGVELEDEFDQGGGDEGTSHASGGGASHGGGGRDLTADQATIFDGLKRTMLKQTLTWHARMVGQTLGITDSDIVEVLGEVADDIAGG